MRSAGADPLEVGAGSGSAKPASWTVERRGRPAAPSVGRSPDEPDDDEGTAGRPSPGRLIARSAHYREACDQHPARNMVADLRGWVGAGDENRTRTISLGSAAVTPARDADLASLAVPSDP